MSTEFLLFIVQLDFKFDVMILTETHLLSDLPFDIPGYRIYYLNSVHSLSDDIVIFVNTETLTNAFLETVPQIVCANAINITFKVNNEIAYNLFNVINIGL